MATKNETIENVKANNVKANESANVNNESANATDESANVNNNAAASTESTDNVNNNNESESKPQATEPTSEQIAAAKVEKKNETVIAKRYKMEAPKEVEVSKFAGAYVLGVYRPTENRKGGDKTFYKIYYSGKIYDGWHSTEFCDEIGIERKHRDGSKSAPKAITLLDKLQALKNAIEAVASTESDFVNFAKIVASKIESEQLESQRAAFVAKYAAAVKFFPKLTEKDFADEYGADDLALALKLGYKFADTKATESDKESDKESTESKESK